MSLSIVYTIKEIDGSSGIVRKSYVLSKTNTKISNQQNLRLDEISTTSDSKSAALTSSTYLTYITSYLKTLFLPTGYPHTVTPDYTPYQIYDSIQAFASSIAGLLSSRAVLQSLNVISSSNNDKDGLPADSASAATAATLLSILQTTLANLTSILFASYAAPRISAEVKFYRFLADVVNDSAFILDLLAPMLSTSFLLPFSFSLFPISLSPRVLVLCVSSMLRAMCGVAGGSSKAVLSTHFARNNPDSVGDLNAKDGSQETVVNLIGMWVGGLVVTRVDGIVATWCWMLGLLGLHLWANWHAVRSVRLRGVNRARASLLCECLMRTHGNDQKLVQSQLSIDRVGSKESILGVSRFLTNLRMRLLNQRPLQQATWQRWQVGASVQDLMLSLRDRSSTTFNAENASGLLRIFEHEGYILSWSQEFNYPIIALKHDSRSIDQLKAWMHAVLVQRRLTEYLLQQNHDIWVSKLTLILLAALKELNVQWDSYRQILLEEGWDLDVIALESGTFVRVEVTPN